MTYEELEAADIETLGYEDLLKLAIRYRSKIANQRKAKKCAVRKLRMKTRALWIASGYISNSGILPKTQHEVYELLKIAAKSELAKEIEELKNSEKTPENN